MSQIFCNIYTKDLKETYWNAWYQCFKAKENKTVDEEAQTLESILGKELENRSVDIKLLQNT